MDIKPTNVATIARMLMSPAHPDQQLAVRTAHTGLRM